ncbi:hypothetical protein XI07_04355 [Bradyrhizobium sp. CCBAU 11445]|nr:hypothetical protein [Bradyrhizobium sp. CCBAU 11445]
MPREFQIARSIENAVDRLRIVAAVLLALTRLLCFQLRQRYSFEIMPMHGLIWLCPPGLERRPYQPWIACSIE